jgi:hypothetical protein
MMKTYLAILLTLFLFVGKNASAHTHLNAETKTAIKPQDDFIKAIIESIPNPLELTTLIKETGAEYRKEDLGNPNSVSKYTDSYEKALNLGLYATDLGYASIYNKNQDVLDYLTAVKELANGLNIGQFFDAETLKELTNSGDNLDKLIRTSTQNLQDINEQLQQEKREHLSVLFVTGGWIESTYLTAQMYKRTKNPKLKERLAEQKLVLERLMQALEAHKAQPKFPALIAQLKEVQKAYRGVKETTVKGESKTEMTDEGPVVTSGDTVTYEISDADANTIETLIKSIRSGFVK